MKLFIFSLFILLNCFGTTSLNASKKDVLNLNMSQDFHQKDPRKVADLVSTSIHFLLHESLMKMTPYSDRPELALAENYSIDASGTEYTFKLKECFYSTGKKITAFDFERSWKEALEPHFNCPNIHLFFAIKNAKKVKKGLIPSTEVGIKALDEKTLFIQLEHPLKPFLEILTFTTFSPYVDESSYSGPFCISFFQLQHSMHLVPNPYHYNKTTQNHLELNISFVKDEMTAFHLFEKGLIHLIGSPFTPLPKEAIEYHQHQYQFQSQPNMGICCLILNKKNRELSNLDLRNSIQKQINRKAITKDLVLIEGKETRFLLPNKIISEHLAPDLKGFKETKSSIKNLTFIYPQIGSYRKIAQFIQQEFLAEWNIHLTLVGLEPSIYIQKLQSQEFDLALNTIFAQYRDPLSILERFYDSEDPKNYPKIDLPIFKQKLDEANFTLCDKKRIYLFQEAEKLLLEDSCIIPLFECSTGFCIHPSIKGVQVNASGGFNFEKLEFSSSKS